VAANDASPLLSQGRASLHQARTASDRLVHLQEGYLTMANFRDVLKPVSLHNGRAKRRLAGFYPALTLNGKVVWTGGDTYRKDNWGEDAQEMARDEAEALLHCPDGSVTAEELQALVEREA
jgi:hypothetical protein